ncbi:MAG: hypothetical protein IE926_04865 [Micrococcales bacterium]|nr:hypothetical protein [Micrococcales bacterium]
MRETEGRRWAAALGAGATLALAGGCTTAPEVPSGPSSSPRSPAVASAAVPCDADALESAPRLLRATAERLRGSDLTVCEAGRGTDGSRSYTVSTVGAARTRDPEVVSALAFDGGPVPDGCEVSSSSRLFVLIEGRWQEARQVGCGHDS